MMFITMDVVAQGNFTTLCMRSMATLFLVSYPVRHLPIYEVHGNTLFGIIRHHYGYNINFPVHALSAITSNCPRSGLPLVNIIKIQTPLRFWPVVFSSRFWPVDR